MQYLFAQSEDIPLFIHKYLCVFGDMSFFIRSVLHIERWLLTHMAQFYSPKKYVAVK